MRRKIRVFLIIVCFLFGCAGCREKQAEAAQLEEAELEDVDSNKEKTEKEQIFVYVCGAVRNEGVYELEAGSRVYEAIEKAGGFTEDAAVTQVNQAEMLEDEARLYVPTLTEIESDPAVGNADDSKSGKINLNTASKEELMTLPGIGESKAESILKYREQQGKFKSIEEIKQIEGIKDGVFEKIKNNITI